MTDHLIVLPASEFERGATGFRLCEFDARICAYAVPGWFDDRFPVLCETFPTHHAAQECAEALGFSVRTPA